MSLDAPMTFMESGEREIPLKNGRFTSSPSSSFPFRTIWGPISRKPLIKYPIMRGRRREKIENTFSFTSLFSRSGNPALWRTSSLISLRKHGPFRETLARSPEVGLGQLSYKQVSQIQVSPHIWCEEPSRSKSILLPRGREPLWQESVFVATHLFPFSHAQI